MPSVRTIMAAAVNIYLKKYTFCVEKNQLKVLFVLAQEGANHFEAEYETCRQNTHNALTVIVVVRIRDVHVPFLDFDSSCKR